VLDISETTDFQDITPALKIQTKHKM